MKKVAIVICVILLLSGAGLGYFALAENSAWYKIRLGDDGLYNYKGYIDYAKEVYFDLDTDPEMADQGLFWARWNAEIQEIELIDADSKQGAELIDPNKPTIINVHGVLMTGHVDPERFFLNSKVNSPEDFGLEGENVSMLYLWMQQGWNVGVFHYNKFACDAPEVIEGKIWSAESPRGVRYRNPNGKYSDPYFTDYSLAEHFAAEYIRAMNLLPKEMGKEEIRIAAHSMGGHLATAGVFLLTELAGAKQLPPHQLPHRLALLDAYFSTRIETNGAFLSMGLKDVNISWSGKPLPYNYTGKAMIDCLKDIKANGIALEYYVYEESLLKMGMLGIIAELRELVPYTVVLPDYNNINSDYSVTTDGHNGVREWYMVSMLSPPIKDATEGRDSGQYARSASLDTATLRQLNGYAYTIVEGAQTPTASDDIMVRRYSIYYQLDGGLNSNLNSDHYTVLNEKVTLHTPRKKGYTFEGWYTNSDFSGEKITQLKGSDKKDVKLYAKWSTS